MVKKKKTQRPDRHLFEKRCEYMLDDLVRKIRTCDYPEGSLLPSESELGKIYSLSRSSIRKMIQKLETQITLTRIQGKGVMVGNTISRSIPDIERKVILILPFGFQYPGPPDQHNHGLYTGNAVYEFERKLAENFIETEFVSFESDKKVNPDAFLEKLEYENIKIVVSLEKDGCNFNLLCRNLTARGIKLISLLKKVDLKESSYVLCNHYKIGQMGAKHLIELGHTKIACIRSDEENDWENLRSEGFLDTCKSYGFSDREDSIFRIENPRKEKDFDMQYIEIGRKGAKHILKHHELTGVFCINDFVAEGLYNLTTEKGMSIPEDLSIIGCDNEMRYLDMNLSTISQEFHQCGLTAGELVIDYFNGKLARTWPVEYRISPILFKRGSSAKLV